MAKVTVVERLASAEDYKVFFDTHSEKAKELMREIGIPFTEKWEICRECSGNGTELTGGLKGADVTDLINDDEDFYDDYMGGKYDVACSGCKGTGKVKASEVDWSTVSFIKTSEFEDAWEEWESYLQELAFEANCRAQGREW